MSQQVNVSTEVLEEKRSIYIDLLSSSAKAPIRKHDGAGMDLFGAEEVVIPPGKVKKVDTDLRISLPKGTYGRICERSGLALRHNLIVKGGVIDRGYTGNIGVILYNHGEDSYIVKLGERIAQLIVEVIYYPCEVVVNSFDPYLESGSQPILEEELTNKRVKRGSDGFGSTGMF